MAGKGITPESARTPGTAVSVAQGADWVSDCGTVRLWCGDALAWLATLDDASVDLICTDPPYFRVKGEWWDRQWDTPQEFVQWMNCLCLEWQRVLKPNGSLYVFASPQMAWHVEGAVRSQFRVLSNIRWRKPPFSTKAEMFVKEELRAPFPASETLLFAEQHGSDDVAMGEAGYRTKCDEAARDVFGKYITAVRHKHRLTMKDLTGAIGAHGAVNHGGACSNWEAGLNVPTRTHYDELQRSFPGCFDREYEDLRREYEDLRRPFTVTADDAYTDVWDFPTVGDYPGKHPCEKPAELIRQIVRASSRPGDTVLDCFCGSGVVGQVANELGRRAILCDIEPHWFEQTKRRVLGMSPVPKGIDKPTPLFPAPPPTQRSFLEER
jgi:adenine-specific DNA-methyltransferase